jgi:hypothetical protein
MVQSWWKIILAFAVFQKKLPKKKTARLACSMATKKLFIVGLFVGPLQ